MAEPKPAAAKPADDGETYLRGKKAADFCGVSTRLVQKWRAEKLLPDQQGWTKAELRAAVASWMKRPRSKTQGRPPARSPAPSTPEKSSTDLNTPAPQPKAGKKAEAKAEESRGFWDDVMDEFKDDDDDAA